MKKRRINLKMLFTAHNNWLRFLSKKKSKIDLLPSEKKNENNINTSKYFQLQANLMDAVLDHFVCCELQFSLKFFFLKFHDKSAKMKTKANA